MRPSVRGQYRVHSYDFNSADSYFSNGKAMWIKPLCRTAIAVGVRGAVVQSTKKQVDCLRCKAILARISASVGGGAGRLEILEIIGPVSYSVGTGGSGGSGR